MIDPTSIDCAYAAGFFDGEGSVMIWRRYSEPDKAGRQQHRLIVSVRQVDRRPLDWLIDRWQGTLVFRAAPRGTNERGAWEWRLSCRRAAQFITAIRPYVVHKAERIDVALQFQGSVGLNVAAGQRGWTAITPQRWEQREALRNQLMALNKRGAA